MLGATQLLHGISEARSRTTAPEITLVCDFDLTVETKAAVVGLRTPELRTCAAVAHPRYGNHQGALCYHHTVSTSSKIV
jgi:hypothetical protein